MARAESVVCLANWDWKKPYETIPNNGGSISHKCCFFRGAHIWGLLSQEKYSNKLSMKALVEKDIIMKNKKKRWGRLHIFLCTFIKGTQGNSKFFNRSARRSKRRKKLRKRGKEGKFRKWQKKKKKKKKNKRENIEALYERLKRLFLTIVVKKLFVIP